MIKLVLNLTANTGHLSMSRSFQNATLLLTRKCRYGGEDEYWVETRETGERGQEQNKKHERKEISEDRIYSLIHPTIFSWAKFCRCWSP